MLVLEEIQSIQQKGWRVYEAEEPKPNLSEWRDALERSPYPSETVSGNAASVRSTPGAQCLRRKALRTSQDQ
jgi:hypothetical protein